MSEESMKSFYQTSADELRAKTRADLERENTKLKRMIGEIGLSREASQSGLVLAGQVYTENEVEIIRMTERARALLLWEETDARRAALVRAQISLQERLTYVVTVVTAAAIAQNRVTILSAMLPGRAAELAAAYLNVSETYTALIGAPDDGGALEAAQLVIYGLIDHIQRTLTDAAAADDLIGFVKLQVSPYLADLITRGLDAPHGKAQKVSALTDEVIARCESTGKKLPDVVRRLAYELNRDRASLDARGREMIGELDAFGSAAKAIKVLRERIKRRNR